MIWDSWSDFFAMGGYALYVWGSISVVFSCMLGEIVSLILRRKSLQLARSRSGRPQAQRTGAES
jgi:heme exporter protein D